MFKCLGLRKYKYSEALTVKIKENRTLNTYLLFLILRDRSDDRKY